MFDLALKRQAKFGNKDIFILTARPQASAPAIQQFAKGLGLNLKIGNIVGLEDGRAKAKADWIVGKVNEGYNDFYVASVGSFVVRIKSGQTVAKGDLLQSNGDGTAKKQSDDTIKSSTFAKVLSNTKIETYSDGSYIVPCSLMC